MFLWIKAEWKWGSALRCGGALRRPEAARGAAAGRGPAPPFVQNRFTGEKYVALGKSAAPHRMRLP
jgi:hypothetical protein